MFFNSLRKRLLLFLFLPVVLFLLGIGLAGYLYMRQALFKEWQETAVLQLERAAHQMDMQLAGPLPWIEALAQTSGAANQEFILKQLEKHPGVSRVTLTWLTPGPKLGRRVDQVSPVTYFYPPDQEAVGLRTDLLDQRGRPLGRLEVIIPYRYLMKDLLASGWMAANQACLVDQSGRYLAHTDPAMASRHCLGETQDPLELAMREVLKEKPFGTLLAPGPLPNRVIGFSQLHGAPWAIMLHAHGSRILAPIWRFSAYYLVAGVLCLAATLTLIHLGVASMVAAIRNLSRAAARVAQGNYGETLPVTSRDEIGQLTQSFNDMVEGLKERDFISNTFGRYVDPELAQELLRRPEVARLGGEKRQVVILFSDLRDFTPLAESLSPEATIHLVNRHFSRMVEIIQEHRGIIIDFLGDAILFFLDPLDGPLAPTLRQALRCALKMQAAAQEMNAAEKEFPPLQMGIGVHAGEVVVGNVGSESRAKYGIIGAAVNLTHRLQAQARGGEVVISEAAYELAQPGLTIKRTIHTHLKGIHDPVTLYVVEDLR
jgi:adenylate cyclase